MELGVLVSDLGIVHTLSKHNRDALLNVFQLTYAWRVNGKGTKPYWYPIIFLEVTHPNPLCKAHYMQVNYISFASGKKIVHLLDIQYYVLNFV